MSETRVKGIGSSIWVKDDNSPFLVVEPPDIVVNKLEEAIDAGDRFAVLTGYHFNSDDEEHVASRSFYVRADSVVAVSQRLEVLDED